MIYKFVLPEQKEFLENLCEALGLEMQDLFNVQYIKEIQKENEELRAECKSLKSELEQASNVVLSLATQIAEIKEYLYNMQSEEIVRELNE